MLVGCHSKINFHFNVDWVIPLCANTLSTNCAILCNFPFTSLWHSVFIWRFVTSLSILVHRVVESYKLVIFFCNLSMPMLGSFFFSVYFEQLLYNDCWHGFWVRSWWPRVLWQAVTLWLVNRGMPVRRGWPVEQVCNRKETTWYENHVIRFRVQSESRVEPGIRSRSEALGRLWGYGLQRVASVGTPGFRKKIWGKKKSPLWAHVSPSISQTYNKLCALSRIKWERYIFIKSVSFVHCLWFCSWLDLWEIYNTMNNKLLDFLVHFRPSFKLPGKESSTF